MAKTKDEIETPLEVDIAKLPECVNQIKLIQAGNAVRGSGKFDSKDIELLAAGRKAGLAGNELVKFIYIGRAGLVESVADQQARVDRAKKKK